MRRRKITKKEWETDHPFILFLSSLSRVEFVKRLSLSFTKALILFGKQEALGDCMIHKIALGWRHLYVEWCADAFVTQT